MHFTAKNAIIRPKTEEKDIKIPEESKKLSTSSTTFLDVPSNSNENNSMDFSRIVSPQNDFDDLPNLEPIDDDEVD